MGRISLQVQIVDVTFILESSVFQDTSILNLFCASVSAQSKVAYFNILTLLMSYLHSNPALSNERVVESTTFLTERGGSIPSLNRLLFLF